MRMASLLPLFAKAIPELLHANGPSHRRNNERELSDQPLADEQCGQLWPGWDTRYDTCLPAWQSRGPWLLATPPGLGEVADDERSSATEGQQPFGEGADPGAWLALIAQRSGKPDLTRTEFQSLVAGHRPRGAQLLAEDWEEANGNLFAFVARLADLASLNGTQRAQTAGEDEAAAVDAEVVLPFGEIAEDASTGERVLFPLNAPGGSPHMAIMGGAGSGKTRTAVFMLKRLREVAEIPLLAFDFKGDLSDNLAPAFGADVVHPPRVPIPLDVLHVAEKDDTSLKEAAARIRESIIRVKTERAGGLQSDALREAVLSVLRSGARGGRSDLLGVARALEAEYQRRQRKPDALSSTLNELVQFQLFEPSLTPADFFRRSWIIKLPQDSSAEMRRLIINLTLDALDRWINSLPDAPLADGRRGLRHITLLDEAHVILSTKLPALSNLVRMSRSKGGVVMLASQSPDDFDGDDEDYLDNMGLTAAFSTQAKPGPTARFSEVAYRLSIYRSGMQCVA